MGHLIEINIHSLNEAMGWAKNLMQENSWLFALSRVVPVLMPIGILKNVVPMQMPCGKSSMIESRIGYDKTFMYLCIWMFLCAVILPIDAALPEDAIFMTKKQVFNAMLAVICFAVTFNLGSEWLRKKYKYILLFYVLTLILMILPLFFKPIGGAHRWIDLSIAKFQPSELARLVWVFVLGHLLTKHRSSLEDGNLRVWFLMGLFYAPLFILYELQSDFGSQVLSIQISAVMVLVAGFPLRRKAMVPAALVGLVTILLVVLLITNRQDRMARILAFRDPWNPAYAEGFQLRQSLIAIARGGLFGADHGEPMLRYLRLPESRTDFIFAGIVESYGLVGVTMLFLAPFLGWILRPLRWAKSLPTQQERLWAIGLSAQILLQGLMHMAVNTGMAPTKGMTMPFLSYGGSSLFVLMAVCGYLCSLSKRRGDMW